MTGIEVDLFDVPTLFGGSLYFDVAENPTALEIWREWTLTVPEEVTSAVAVLPFPDIPPVPAPLRGKYIAQVQFAILGDGGEDLIKPLRAIGRPALDTVGELPHPESGKIFAEPERPDSYSSRNVLLSELDRDALATLPKLAGPHAQAMCVIGIRHLGGALTQPADNAVGHRDAAYSLTVLSPGERDVTELHRTVLDPWSAFVVGRFLNFTFGPLTPDEVREAYEPDAWNRLTELRARYDADRRLVANHQL